MATYKEIRGVNIQSRDADPTAVEGDVWYNASTSKLKMYASAGSWATGEDMNLARIAGGAGGTQTAGIFIAGDTPGSDDEVETYDGTNWTEVADLNTAEFTPTLILFPSISMSDSSFSASASVKRVLMSPNPTALTLTLYRPHSFAIVFAIPTTPAFAVA